jgi:hypothetical protein
MLPFACRWSRCCGTAHAEFWPAAGATDAVMVEDSLMIWCIHIDHIGSLVLDMWNQMTLMRTLPHLPHGPVRSTAVQPQSQVCIFHDCQLVVKATNSLEILSTHKDGLIACDSKLTLQIASFEPCACMSAAFAMDTLLMPCVALGSSLR